MNELRLAPGTRFQHILDSYLYAVAEAGMAEDYMAVGDAGYIYLLTGNLGDQVARLGREQKIKESELGFTPDELEHLRIHQAAVILEDEHSRCDVEWFRDPEDAANFFEEFRFATKVQVTSGSLNRSLSRPLAQEE